MLSKKDIEFCNDIRRYGEFVARYDRNKVVTYGYDETDSIVVYEYESQLYYIVMDRGEFIDYFKGGM